jgi:ribosomal protein L37AE/L43A
MGIRSRTSRDNHHRQKRRGKARRQVAMLFAKPRCPECEGILVEDAAMPDLWNCRDCGVSMLRMGSYWLTQIEAPALSLAEYVAHESARKAA